MNGKIKKTLALLAGFSAGLFFVLTVCIDGMLVIDIINGEISFGAACFLIAFSVLVMCICMFFVIYFNRIFDAGEGLVQKNIFMGRWPMNALFISLVMTVLFVMSYANQSDDRGLLAARAHYSPVIFLIAVLTAVMLYIRNYHRFKPRNKQVQKAAQTYALNKKRRFTFVIEKYLDDGGIYGTVQGQIRVHDGAYVLNCEDGHSRITVDSIIKDGKNVRYANDGKAVIRVKIPKKKSVPEPVWYDYTVLSNELAGHTIYRRIAAENPRVRAMLGIVADYSGDRQYMSSLIYDIVHGNYLVPAKTDEENARSGDITEAVSGSHSVMFPAVSSSNSPDQSVLPVFTDWDALSRYKNVMEDEKSVILVMDFQQASEMLSKGYEGFVINPFGPAAYFLSREYINSIKSLEGYQREFVMKEETE